MKSEKEEAKPLISVIVPVYNVEQRINKCLDSIMTQTYSNIEVIVIDDASVDESSNLCDEYTHIDDRFQVTHFQVNRGPSAARNEGIRRANGKYIAFVDADDYVEPSMLDRLYENLVENEADVSVCGFDYVGQWKKVKKREVGLVGNYSGRVAVDYAVRFDSFGMVAWGKLYLSEIVKKTFFCEEIYCSEDYVFFYQIGKQIKKISFFSEVLYHYVYREGSLINSMINKRKCTVLLAYDYLCQDASKNFPELLPQFQKDTLGISASFAFKVLEDPMIRGKEFFGYLQTFQKNIRYHFSWKALALSTHRKTIIVVLILYVSKIAFWGIAAVYLRIKRRRYAPKWMSSSR